MLALRYLIRVVPYVAMILLIYFVIMRVLKKNGTEISRKLDYTVAVVVCFIIILYLTVFSRFGGRIKYDPLSYPKVIGIFSSIREAYTYASFDLWINIFFNILLFIPAGFMLPKTYIPARKWYIVYVTGFFLSLGIELLQLIFWGRFL